VTRIRAPYRLGMFQDYAPRTIAFISRIRAAVADVRARDILIDFHRCSFISRAACLLITAELERGRHLCNGCISFVPPADDELADFFDAFGVYSYFRVASPLSPSQRRARRKNSLVVRSDGPSAKGDVFEIEEVASVALKVCGEERLARSVEEALQEALWNAKEHAYADMDPNSLPDSRWWFAGLYDPEAQEAFFYALDHGQGIPRRAQTTMRTEVEAFLGTTLTSPNLSPEQATDRDLLRAAIRAPRLNVEGRGKGLPTMVGLADHALDGEVRIYSGRAMWHGRRRKKADAAGSRTFERCYHLKREFPGTLVYWRVSGPVPHDPEGST